MIKIMKIREFMKKQFQFKKTEDEIAKNNILRNMNSIVKILLPSEILLSGKRRYDTVIYDFGESKIRKELKKWNVNMTLHTEFNVIGKSWWTMSGLEYEKVFNNYKVNYAKKLRNKIEDVECLDSIKYQAILFKYDIPIENIHNTFKESMELNGYISDILAETGFRIINRMLTEIAEREKQLAIPVELDEQAINKSLEERLIYEDNLTSGCN